ncbi:DsbA family oxidoreductase [Aquamicrobium zhengzhouense]|uniref:DsbA family oxidoreductase n=1 Tax=Aquamicrobium zhengzhouense TaxID=2781738 RepID=A0ABS0S819_9HYPH|nr:DsbA family oxidoreductase [Aquamicrobium zhengzhouense]MBI1619439.1 DsbA family oxidoreductase [Aquamicrobium zhengzhouense]
MLERTELVIDVISDVVCPWCFIGMKRLEQAISLIDDVQIKPRWRPFQLDPDVPAKGLPRAKYMLDKFGSEERITAMHAQIAQLGELDGIRFNFEDIQVAPNTLDSHRLIRWAGSPKAPDGTQSLIVKRLFELYFEEGRDIGDHKVLTEAAEECGMDGGLVAALLLSPADIESLRAEMQSARAMGVSGVPSFVLENRYVLVGAQETTSLVDALRQVASAKARGELSKDA